MSMNTQSVIEQNAKRRRKSPIHSFLDPLMTAAEVATELGISRSLVDYIEGRALKKIEAALRRRGICSADDICP
jgi:DNA-directed RNA polymerase specialized sigma subunit